MKLKKQRASRCPRELKEVQSDLLKLILNDDGIGEPSKVQRRASKIVETGDRSAQFCIAQYRNSYIRSMAENLELNFSASLSFMSKKSRDRLLKEYCAFTPPSSHFMELISQFPSFVIESNFDVLPASDKKLLHSLLQLDLAVFELSSAHFPKASKRSQRILHFDSPILDLWLSLRSRKTRQKRSLQKNPETLKVWISADREILFQRIS